MTLEEIRAAIDAAATSRFDLVAEIDERRSNETEADVLGVFVVDADGNDTEQRNRPELVGLTADEADRWVTIEREEARLEADLVRAEKVAAGAAAQRFAEPPNVNINHDPHDIERTVRSTVQEMRGQARAAIDATDAPAHVLEQLHELTRSAPRRVAAHIAATTAPDYRAAFTKAVIGGIPLSDDEQRALAAVNWESEEMRTALSVGSSGWSLPVTVDPTMVNTSDVQVNPFRQLATVSRSTTNTFTVNQGAGATAEWVAEGTEVADATPTMATKTITCYLADTYVQFSYMSEQDVGQLESELLTRISESKDTLEATAHVTGTGSSQPFGIVTSLLAAGSTTVAASATALADVDLREIRNDLQNRHRARASRVGDQATFDAIRGLDTGTGGNRLWAMSIEAGNPDRLYGSPVYDCSTFDAPTGDTFTTATEPLVYGDIASCFRIVDRVGMFVVPQDVVIGSNQRPTGQRGLVGFWRTGSDVVNENAARVLQMA